MTSSKAKTKRIVAKTLPKFKLDVYSQLTLSELIVFALSYLEEKQVDATTEEIISICFRLFPNSFGLKNYPRWPDSALVIRRLNDVREKKLVKGNPNDGFALTFKGKQFAKRVTKALGILPKEKAKPTSKQNPDALVLTKKTLHRQVRKSTQAKLIKKKITKQKPTKKKIGTKKTTQKAVIKKQVVPKVKPKQVNTVKKKVPVNKPQPKQLTLALPPIQTKKKNEVKKKQLEVKKEAISPKPKSVEVVKTIPAPVVVSKEEKIKAGKVIKLVEKSDAYRLYAKNGKHAKISEFDFRNMLFATMESSSDTLMRNVGLFRRYANIYNRNDLIKFFDYCEENFAWILKKKR